ncbi:MAG: DUF5063 domain-containing protein [Lachnospiraceae bacterium]|nr:DUF5063 domain-containing protein [Lachnospiraceae bacterium]
MNNAKKFYEQADEYCRFIAENVITTDTVSSLVEMLMTLYISAMNLPETEPETIASSSDTSEAVTIRFTEQIPTTYWEIFDPYADEDPVCGDLIDDLSDIAADMRDGMKEYEADRFGNAIFEWKLGLNNHWGQHVVDALRALHAIRAR